MIGSSDIKKAFKENSKPAKLDKRYMMQINNSLDLQIGSIPEYKIRRTYNKILQLAHNDRLC